MKLRIFKAVLIPVILFFCFCSAQAQDEIKWNVEKSTHFLVYYKDAKKDFIDEIIRYSEDYYDKIADNLGFRRYDFWLWDNRAKIYIYDDADDYQDSTGQSSLFAGHASIKNKTIYTYPYEYGFFETTLPHEMGHIIFREFVGFDNPAIPLWLDEGVASFQESARIYSADAIVQASIRDGQFMPLEDLSLRGPLQFQNRNTVNIFYAESVSIVNYLIKQFGRDNFVRFCQRLRDRRSLQDALDYTYSFKNLQDLGNAWKKKLTNE